MSDASSTGLTPFHLAFPVHDLESAREFYTQALGAGTGRESDHWIDFDLHGHQIVADYKEGMTTGIDATNAVDGDDVPVPHFGVVLTMEDWKAMAERLQARADTRWVIEPRIRFEGQPGEQATFFLLDPSGNALEFKAFADMSALFAT
ncbi:MAG: VOC family protein [Pseudomonadota bacterium]